MLTTMFQPQVSLDHQLHIESFQPPAEQEIPHLQAISK
jgi:hypothetical protein